MFNLQHDFVLHEITFSCLFGEAICIAISAQAPTTHRVRTGQWWLCGLVYVCVRALRHKVLTGGRMCMRERQNTTDG